jgi:hypothetical protein
MNKSTQDPVQHPTPKTNPALVQLEVLIGEWEMELSLAPAARGRVTFEWLEGGAFLVERMGDSATWLIGRDESVETYCVLYFDSRGVSRLYEMSLEGNVWKIWRNAPGFSQRFAATFGGDGHTITGYWEKSSDGSTWEHDFDVTYTKLS